MMGRYSFENAWSLARRRPALLEESSDPATQAWIRRLGVREGWQCWDVGARGGSIARWLAQEVRATDIDTRHREDMQSPNAEIRSHDVVQDPLPSMSFDLVHTRLLLMHHPAREELLPQFISTRGLDLVR